MASFRCDHIHYRTTDVPAFVEFFEKMLGAEVFSREVSAGVPLVRVRLGDINLTLSGPPKGVPELLPAKGKVVHGLDHLALAVDDLDAVAADLKAKGARFITEPTQSSPHLKISFIEGPAGIRIEVLQRM